MFQFRVPLWAMSDRALTSCFFCSAFIAATLASISARFAALAASSIVCELVWVRLFAPATSETRSLG